MRLFRNRAVHVRYKLTSIISLLVSSNDKAWAHKERLLKYDREHARRTIVIDDHADYFKADVWMTSSEQDLAAEEEQSRHDALHKKGKMRLQVDM